MAQITLTDDEAGMLKEILGSYLSDLRMEIADTDRKDYREELNFYFGKKKIAEHLHLNHGVVEYKQEERLSCLSVYPILHEQMLGLSVGLIPPESALG